MDDKSKRRIKRYFDQSSLTGENQSTAIFIPYDPAYNHVQNEQRASVLCARLRLIDCIVGRLQASVKDGPPRDIFVVRSPTGHDPYGRQPFKGGYSPDQFKKWLLSLADTLAPYSFLLALPRKPIERLSMQKSGEYSSELPEGSLALSDALLGWLQQSPEVSNVKVREFTRLPDTIMGKWALSYHVKKDWRQEWEKSNA